MERNKLKYNMTHNGEKPARHGSRLYLPPTNYIVSAPSCSARAIQKKLISERKAIEIFLGKVRRISCQQTNDMIERTQGLGRRTREETGKGNQMRALRFSK